MHNKRFTFFNHGLGFLWISLTLLAAACDSNAPEAGLSIASFTPARDTLGATITINGTGFSTTASDQQVKFNNADATVLTATATTLTVKVPDAATTGKITVQRGSLSATSAEDFTVTGWAKRKDFAGVARVSAAGFAIGSKVYMGFGVKRFAGVSAFFAGDFFEYDPATDTWTQKAGHPRIKDDSWTTGAIPNPITFTIGNKGYLGLGNAYSTENGNELWEYDPATNAWTRKASYPASPSAAIINAMSFVVNNKAYVVGGYAGTAQRTCYEYNPATDTWTRKADFPESDGIYRAGAFAIGTKGYVGLGVVSGGTKRMWEFDPAANQWTEKASFPGEGSADGVGFAVGGKGYMVGYTYQDNGFYEYDPATNQWTKRSMKPRKIAFNLTLVANNRVFFGGGLGNLNQAYWEFMP